MSKGWGEVLGVSLCFFFYGKLGDFSVFFVVGDGVVIVRVGYVI